VRKTLALPINKFREAYQKVGWIEHTTKDGKYIIWSNPKDKDTWIQLPKDDKAVDYNYFAEQNIKMLLYILDLPENDQSIDEIISQLRAYNYKMVNRIVGNSELKSDSIPYELATIVPQKNIEAFRHFYLTRPKTSMRSIPIEKFQMNHTEVGSFVIPVSILVEEDKNETIIPLQSETNLILHEYLTMVDTLVNTEPVDAIKYAQKIVGEHIDSKIVKDFLGKTNSIAKATEKYQNQIEKVTISSSGSPILDYDLTKPEKEFKVVNIGKMSTLGDDFIEEIERLEVKMDDSKVEEYSAHIDVVVDSIDRNGNVKLSVTAINNKAVKKVFKANISEVSKARLDKFAEYFKNDGSAVVRGDIFKPKGKMGKIIIETVGPEVEDKNTKLFDR